MKNYITAFICAISLSFSLPLFSQCLWRETVINFDKEEENKKSFLGVISYKDAEYTDLVFIKKKQKDEVVYETIRLDKELYTVEKFEEADKDFGKDVYKGETHTRTIPMLKTDILGISLIIESIELRYKWDWLSGDYSLVLQKKKKQTPVKTDASTTGAANSMQYLTQGIDSDKEELFLVLNKPIPKNERDNPRYKTFIHKYNSELEQTGADFFELDHEHTLIYSGFHNLDGAKFVMVMAPQVSTIFASKIPHNPDQYKLIIIDENGKVEKILDFFTSCHRWKINGISFFEDEIILYGVGEQLIGKENTAGKPQKYTYYDSWEESIKPAHIQIITVKKDGASAKTQVIPIADFKHIAQSIDKYSVSSLILEGKFDLQRLQKNKNGRIFLTGVAYNPYFYPRAFSNYFILNIDPAGQLRHLFCMRNPQVGAGPLNAAKSYPGESYVYESPNNPDQILWTLRYVDKVDFISNLAINVSELRIGEVTRSIKRYTPVMYEIDASSGAYKECTDRLDKGFFLFGDFVNQDDIAMPHVELSTPGEWLLLGRKKQNSLWIGKLVR